MSISADMLRRLADTGATAEMLATIATAVENASGEEAIATLIADLQAVGCPTSAIGIAAYALADKVINGARLRSSLAEAERTARYRERRGLSDDEWYRLRNAVIQRDGYSCAYCGSHCDTPHCDHIVPLNRGGSNDLDNLTVACPQCNASKRDSLLTEWSPPAGGWL